MLDNKDNKKKQRKENFLDKLPPQYRKWVYIGSTISIIAVALYTLTADVGPSSKKDEIKYVLTDKNADALGMESLLAQIKIANDKFAHVEKQLEELSADNNLTRKEYQKNKQAIMKANELDKTMGNMINKYDTQMKALNDRITELAQSNQALTQKMEENDAEMAKLSTEEKEPDKDLEISPNDSPKDKAEKAALQQQRERERRKKEEQSFLDRSVNVRDANALYANAPTPIPQTFVDKDGNEIVQGLSTSFASEDLSKKPKKAEANKDPEVYIPAGSMLKGVLLAGIDAPTGTNAKKDPFPVNIRIQKEAILPNGYQADVKECFLLMSGYGDMSSERALLRGETLSCIKEDGSIIETKLPSYAAGDDGKAGLRGRLVSKTGSVIARTMLAGFASGISSAFDVTMTPTLNTSPDGTVSYSKVYDSSALQGAAATGVSKAFDRLSDYYMNLADQMFPIIEVDGGREVTIIVSGGATLSVVKDANENGNSCTGQIAETSDDYGQMADQETAQ